MMKNKFALAIGAAFLASALALPATVHADTTQADSKNTTATIDVKAPTNAGPLTIKQAPDFTFDATIKTIGTPKLPSTADRPVIVDDARGTNAGWNLTMTLGAFNGGISGAYMGWSGNMLSGDTGAVVAGNDTATEKGDTTSAAAIMSAAPGTGDGTTTLTFNHLNLTTGKVAPIIAQYQAPVTWSLSSTQTGETPSTTAGNSSTSGNPVK